MPLPPYSHTDLVDLNNAAEVFKKNWAERVWEAKHPENLGNIRQWEICLVPNLFVEVLNFAFSLLWLPIAPTYATPSSIISSS